MAGIDVLAPAKINLTLHVTGQRADGYHLLDSLVAFASVGDLVRIVPHATRLSLCVDGPEATGVPVDDTNLILKAARLLCPDGTAGITLTKNLPVASGIGGGSADAAATLRGLAALGWGDVMEGNTQGGTMSKMLGLGADIPMCMVNKPCRVRGIGELVVPIEKFGPIPAILVNPRVAVPTPLVFRRLTERENPPMPEEIPAAGAGGDGLMTFIVWLADQRNDLAPPALALAPVIGTVLDQIGQSENCLLSRMSGSGATCFGLFPDPESAMTAAARIGRAYPDWWCVATSLADQSGAAAPQIS